MDGSQVQICHFDQKHHSVLCEFLTQCMSQHLYGKPPILILQITKGGDIDFINYVGAVFGLLVMFYIPTKAFNIVYECPNLDSFEFRKRYKILIAGLKTSDPLKYQFT